MRIYFLIIPAVLFIIAGILGMVENKNLTAWNYFVSFAEIIGGFLILFFLLFS